MTPTFDPARDGLTVLTFELTYAGFGLLLAAMAAAASLLGGLAWGEAG